MSIKRVLFISGYSASGKTMSARWLAGFLKANYIEHDRINSAIIDKKTPQEFIKGGLSVVNKNWNKIKPEQIKDFYKELFKDIKEETVIIEGTFIDYGWVREAIIEALEDKNIRLTHVKIRLPYSKWVNNWKHSRPKEKVMESYEYYQNVVKIYSPDKYIKEEYLVENLSNLVIKQAPVQYQSFGDIKGVSDSKGKFELMKLGDELKGNTVLDLGCNEGYTTELARLAGAKEATGFEFDFKWTYQAVERFPECNYELYDVKKLIDEDRQWDYVFAFSMAHYFDWIKLMRAISKVCKKCLVFEGPMTDSDFNGMDYFKKGLRNDMQPTSKFFVNFMSQYYNRIELVGKSISPGRHEYRAIYKCYK